MEGFDLSVRSECRSLSHLAFLKDEDSSRYQCHGLFSYPAMMVPRLQGALMDELLSTLPPGAAVYDPFMGSGTVLSESLYRGVDFYGTDINPLALLCCEVKSDIFEFAAAHSSLRDLVGRVERKYPCANVRGFSGVDKWFPEIVKGVLSCISEEIALVDERWCRRLFWLSLAETVRKFSRTRNSTYKLHVDKKYKAPEARNVIEWFKSTCIRNIDLKRQSWNVLSDNGYLHNCTPTSNVVLELADSRCATKSFSVDLVVTSPPYGDNRTTVTYGQFSYLPLQFIDLNDIEQKFDRSIVDSANGIDSVSLGGSLKSWREKWSEIRSHSETLKSVGRTLEGIGRGGESRLAAFAYDLREAFVGISQRVNPGGVWMMTLGNRKINGVSIPLDRIVSEFLCSLGFSELVSLERQISRKRMAGSMSTERILIMKKNID